jgi:flagellar hook-associated protein 1
MPGLNAGLNIGLSGLQAAQGALGVVGHNIANVNTPNYSRQQVTLSSNTPQLFGTLEYGTGVSLTNIMGVRDKYLEMQITQSTGRQSGAQTRYASVQGLSSVFQDDGTTGLNTSVANFFKSFQQLAARPEDIALRTNVVGQAQSLVNSLQSRYQLLEDQRKQADQGIGDTVTEINTLTTQIASLNARITGEPSPGADSDGRDQRQALINQLAGLVGVQVFEDNRNQMQITLDSGAAVLVSGSSSYNMAATPDAALNNFNRVTVDMGGAAPMDVTTLIQEGSLGANLDLRDNIMTGYETNLDELAAGLVSQTNLAHRGGFDLSGAAVLGTNWQDFFLGTVANGANGLPTTITAASNYRGMVSAMAVNSFIVASPSRIAAAGAAGSPGNNANANIIANLQNATTPVDTNGDGVGDSGPFNAVITSLVGTIGTNVQSYQATSTTQDNLLSALKTQRDRVSAVDMDEEATSLLTYQRSYQASAHFISVVDQLMAQLMTQFAQ